VCGALPRASPRAAGITGRYALPRIADEVRRWPLGETPSRAAGSQ